MIIEIGKVDVLISFYRAPCVSVLDKNNGFGIFFFFFKFQHFIEQENINSHS
jgi:hypothetical protein